MDTTGRDLDSVAESGKTRPSLQCLDTLPNDSPASLLSPPGCCESKETPELEAGRPSSNILDSQPDLSNLTDTAGPTAAQATSGPSTKEETLTDSKITSTERHVAPFVFTASTINEVKSPQTVEQEPHNPADIHRSTDEEESNESTDAGSASSDGDSSDAEAEARIHAMGDFILTSTDKAREALKRIIDMKRQLRARGFDGPIPHDDELAELEDELDGLTRFVAEDRLNHQ